MNWIETCQLPTRLGARQSYISPKMFLRCVAMKTAVWWCIINTQSSSSSSWVARFNSVRKILEREDWNWILCFCKMPLAHLCDQTQTYLSTICSKKFARGSLGTVASADDTIFSMHKRTKLFCATFLKVVSYFLLKKGVRKCLINKMIFEG